MNELYDCASQSWITECCTKHKSSPSPLCTPIIAPHRLRISLKLLSPARKALCSPAPAYLSTICHLLCTSSSSNTRRLESCHQMCPNSLSSLLLSIPCLQCLFLLNHSFSSFRPCSALLSPRKLPRLPASAASPPSPHSYSPEVDLHPCGRHPPGRSRTHFLVLSLPLDRGG